GKNSKIWREHSYYLGIRSQKMVSEEQRWKYAGRHILEKPPPTKGWQHRRASFRAREKRLCRFCFREIRVFLQCVIERRLCSSRLAGLQVGHGEVVSKESLLLLSPGDRGLQVPHCALV